MSQLKIHQLAYRQRERRIIAERLEKAEEALKEFGEKPPDDVAEAMHIEGLIKSDIRYYLELIAALDRRVERLS